MPVRTEQIYFNALLPATPEPPNGYPVVIFGHGSRRQPLRRTDSGGPTLARAGFAVIAINAVGHGFGPLSTVTFTDNHGQQHHASLRAAAAWTSTAMASSNPRKAARCSRPVAYGTRDCFRQTAVDLMQLARTIRLGLDLNGDGKPDLDPSRIYYAGQSLGAIYGSMIMAVEPTVRAAALNVGGATVVDIARWSPSYIAAWRPRRCRCAARRC